MALVPIRSDRAYMALAKQSAQGTSVTPTYFPRWVDGSSIEMDLKIEDLWEGDNTRRLSQMIKNSQMVKIKHVCYPRPNEVALLEGAAMGASSDSYSAPATGTSLTTSGSGNTANSTTLTLSASTGLGSSGSAQLVLSPGTANEEVVTVTTPGTANAFTVTVPSTGLKFTHANGQVAEGPASHVITDQADGNYYTWEVSLGDSSGIILRVRDCKCESIKRGSKSGTVLSYETEWVGIATVVQGSALTVTLDAHNVFLYTQGVWTLDGASTGDALNVDSFDITTKNNLDPVQTEQLTMAAIIFGNVNMDVSAQIIYANGNKIAQIYFGGTSGTTDSQTIYLGSLTLVFTQPDNFHTITYTIPTLAYTKAGLPQPKKDGKDWRLPLTATSTSNQGANTYLLQTTVTNTTYSAVA